MTVGEETFLRVLRKNTGTYIEEEMYQLDATSMDQQLWMPVITENIVQKAMMEEKLKKVEERRQRLQTLKVEEEFLVTRTIGAKEVQENLKDWEEAIRNEYNQLVRVKGAVQQVKKAELKDLAERTGKTLEIFPGKMVYTRKAVTGAFRARAVICGNFAERAEDHQTNYAGGADGCQVRAMLRTSALRSWKNATTDISTAFLNAPRREDGKLIAMEPPAIYRQLGLVGPDELWWVRLALYGLTTSPKDWSTHRDGEIPKFRWVRSRNGHDVCGWFEASGDDNLWRIMEKDMDTGEVTNTGLMTIYVDDILISAEEGAMTAAMTAIGNLWTCSKVEVASTTNAIKFCGFEIIEDENGDGLHIHQRLYEKEILEKWNITRGTEYPNYRINEENEDMNDEEMSTDEMRNHVREAQQLAGSLLWLSTRTRPDLACGVATMGRLVTKDPCRAVSVGYSLLRYLHDHPGDLHYTKDVLFKWGPRNQLKRPRTAGTVEVFADISYASDDCRSVQGLLICYGGCPVSWSSSRQAYATHSTSEAELTSYCESLVAGRATEALLAAIWGVPIGSDMFTRIIYGDNLAAISLAKGRGQSSWRTRHLRIRARLLREAVEGRGPDGAVWASPRN